MTGVKFKLFQSLLILQISKTWNLSGGSLLYIFHLGGKQDNPRTDLDEYMYIEAIAGAHYYFDLT